MIAIVGALIVSGLFFALGNYYKGFLIGLIGCIYGAVFGYYLFTAIILHYSKKYWAIAISLFTIAVGFCIGEYFSFLWGIFGCVLAALLSGCIFFNDYFMRNTLLGQKLRHKIFITRPIDRK